LRVAILVQEILIEKKELHKMKKKTLKTLQKTNDKNLSLKDFEEETQLKNNLIAFQTKYNPFTIVNSSPDLLN
jgi:hypothetical protein